MRSWKNSWLSSLLALSMPFFLGASEGEKPLAPYVLRFKLEAATLASPPGQGSLQLRPISGRGDSLFLELRPERPLMVELPPHSTWELDAELPGFWTPRKIINAGAPGATYTEALRLWPTASVRGTLRLADRAIPTPKVVTMQFESSLTPGRPREIARAAVACPVADDGAFSCKPPASLLDFSLRADSFIPHYLWRRELRPATATELGAIVFEAGASVAGWVATEGSALAPGKCLVHLSSFLAPGNGGVEVTEQLRKVSLEAPVSERGFFQIKGVAPGTYVLKVQQPGLAPASVAPIEAWPNAETLLKDAVILKPPFDIEISIRPSVDWLGKPWGATVFRRSALGGGPEQKPIFQAEVSRSGVIRIPGQAPGLLDIAIADHAGNRFLSKLSQQVAGPEDARIDVEIPLIWVEGTLSFRGQALSAQLHFGGRHGAMRVALDSDEEGRFSGPLPRGGSWRVEVEAQEPSLQTHFKVKVEPDATGVARLKLRVPDTHLFGSVVDEAEQPIADARVSISSSSGHLETLTSKDGHFEARALPVGPLALFAEAGTPTGHLTSPPLVVQSVDEQSTGPVLLKLEGMQVFDGAVQSARGPVPGAIVSVSPIMPEAATLENARTELSGRFQVKIPRRSRRAVVAVSPPGHALTVFEVPVSQAPTPLFVSTEGGSLEVIASADLEEGAEPGWTLAIFQNGVPLRLTTAIQWAFGHGLPLAEDGRYLVPNVAPGEYAACAVPRTMADASERAFERLSSTGGCKSGYLAPGGKLTLEPRPPTN